MEELFYRINKSSEKDVFKHLKCCDDYFVPPLSTKVNIEEYSEKIHKKATRIEAWENENLIGLIAFYQNQLTLSIFITNVSIDINYLGNGIANKLMKNTIEFAKRKKMIEILLEVDKNNDKAIGLYKKYNFVITEQHDKSLFLKLTI